MTERGLNFHDDAVSELLTIAGHYEELAVGLGSEFVSAFDEAFLHIRQFPYLYPGIEGSIRRAVLHRFPFGLFYEVTEGVVRVIAVFPLRANPDNIAHLLTVRSH